MTDPASAREDLHELCALGQRLLAQTRYVEARDTLEAAERLACDVGDFDSLARLYLPLQESRRQIRQRCAEGRLIVPELVEADHDPHRLLETQPATLIPAAVGSIEPALRLRALAGQRRAMIECFLVACYPLGDRQALLVVPDARVRLPRLEQAHSPDALLRAVPHAILLSKQDWVTHDRPGDVHATAKVMSLWERLTLPFLADANAMPERTPDDIMRKIDRYRRAIEVDNACEPAHQQITRLARSLARTS